MDVSNSTVNTVFPTAASMRNESTNTTLQEEKKFVRNHDCLTLGLLDPEIELTLKQLNWNISKNFF